MRNTSIRFTAALLFAGFVSSSALAQCGCCETGCESGETACESGVEETTAAVETVGFTQAASADRSPEEIARIVASMKEMKKAAIDQPAPDFKLVDTMGKEHLLSDYVAAGNIVVLEWFNPQCPYVKEHYDSEGKGTSTAVEKEFKEQKVVWLRINSGSAESGTSGKEYNNKYAKDWKITSPILLDLDGKVGKAYNAKVTPTMVVISAGGTIAYEGLMDSEKSASKTGEVIYPREAVKSLLSEETVAKKQTKAVGCGIKYSRKSSD